VVLAALLFMRRMAEITKANLTGDAEPGRSGTAMLPPALANQVGVYDIAGPLFFGAAQKAMGSLGIIAGRLKVLIVRLEHVPVMDATGLVALESAVSTLTKHGCLTILTGLQAQPMALLERAGFRQRPWRLEIRPDFASAVKAAEEALAAAADKGPPPDAGGAAPPT
jgi:SulP family sulfate permease